MSDKARRKELREQQAQSPPEAGVYLIRNTATGKSLLGAASNLASVRNKLAFAQSTGTTGVLAEISHWWFRNEPPKAAWKKLSAIA